MIGSKTIERLKDEFKKPTPFLLLGIFGVIFLSYYIFFDILPLLTVGIAVKLTLRIILPLVVAIIIDRVVVRKYRMYPIILTELIVISLIYYIIAWSIKAATLIVKARQEQFIVVFMEGGPSLDNFSYTNPFKKELITDDRSCIVLDKSLIYLDKLEIKPHAWKNYSMKSEDIYINGSLRTVKIYWMGNKEVEIDKFQSCLDSL